MTSFNVGRLLHLQPLHGPWQRGVRIQWHGICNDWRPPSFAAFIHLHCHCDLSSSASSAIEVFRLHFVWNLPLDFTVMGDPTRSLSSRRHRSQVHWNPQGSSPQQGGHLWLTTHTHTHTQTHTQTRTHTFLLLSLLFSLRPQHGGNMGYFHQIVQNTGRRGCKYVNLTQALQFINPKSNYCD